MSIYGLKGNVFPQMKSFVTILLLFLTLTPFSTVFSRENPSILCKEALTLANQGNFEQAIPLFERSIALSPRSALAHYGLGRSLLYKPGNEKKAAKELKTAVDCDHKMVKAYFYLGFAYWFQKKYEYAISAFYQAYTIDRSFKESLYNIGALYSEMGHESKSTRFFREYQKVLINRTDPF
jgi:tetratricopeptide (TPR) repeat protein